MTESCSGLAAYAHQAIVPQRVRELRKEAPYVVCHALSYRGQVQLIAPEVSPPALEARQQDQVHRYGESHAMANLGSETLEKSLAYRYGEFQEVSYSTLGSHSDFGHPDHVWNVVNSLFRAPPIIEGNEQTRNVARGVYEEDRQWRYGDGLK